VPFDVGPWELVILLGVLVLLFGAKGVPDVAKRLGMGMREMKNAMGEVDPRRMLDPAEPPAPSGCGCNASGSVALLARPFKVKKLTLTVFVGGPERVTVKVIKLVPESPSDRLASLTARPGSVTVLTTTAESFVVLASLSARVMIARFVIDPTAVGVT